MISCLELLARQCTRIIAPAECQSIQVIRGFKTTLHPAHDRKKPEKMYPYRLKSRRTSAIGADFEREKETVET